MHRIVKHGLGFMALTSLLAACAANSDKTAAPDEHEGTTSQALGEMACASASLAHSDTDPKGQTITTQTNGCMLSAAVISPDTNYGIPGCEHQYLLNITHVIATQGNPVKVIPHAFIPESDCPNTQVTLGVYARDDHQNNPWTVIGTTTSNGVWNGHWCTWDTGAKNQINLPTTTAYTSIMIAASAATYTYWKGVGNPGWKLVSIEVDPTSCP